MAQIRRKALERIKQNANNAPLLKRNEPSTAVDVETDVMNGKKKRKITPVNTKTKEQKLCEIRTKFNLAVNELFQLKEYNSIVNWNPADYSAQVPGHHLPELFETFLKDPKYKLTWDEEIESTKGLDSLPLRLQKKVLAEIDNKLIEKYPFKEKVIQESNKLELELLDRIHQVKHNVPESKSKRIKPVVTTKPLRKGQKHKTKQEIKENDDEEPLEGDFKDDSSHYKLKSIKYTLPPPIVTHPSHIPLWRATPAHEDGSINGPVQGIVEFNPTPITVIKSSDGSQTVPDLQLKLSNFLKNNIKTAIVDDTLEYSNSPEEYENIMKLQEDLLKQIYHKTNIDNTMELNGDKVELRKVVLPTSNLKLVSDPFRSTGSILPKVQGTSNNLTHHDFFVNQGVSFSKIHQQMRRQHQLRTKKIAQMVEQHFKKKKGEKDRLAREQELNLRRISRMAMQAVKKRWAQASKVYSYIQQEKEEELKKIKGRKHLSKMLEHSTQLLEAQLQKPNKSEDDNSDSDEDMDSDDHLSSSSDEEDVKENNDLKVQNGSGDMNLSVEELRRKYANLEESVEPSSAVNSSTQLSDESDSTNSSNDDSDEEINVKQGLSALYGGKPSSQKIEPIEMEYTEDQKRLIEEIAQDNTSNSILGSDSNDSLSESSSEDGSEDGSDHNSSGSESEVDDVPTEKSNGLASLLGNEIKDEDESDAEIKESDIEEESDEEDSDVSMESEEDTKSKANGDVSEDSKDPLAEEIVNGAKVQDVPLPPLLRGTLRPYQKQGLNWLASLYNNNTNGILADEMGLGKTIQTISLLSYLASEHHIWGPHLIIVPTSVMLNWEMEFKKFAPGFKVMTYYGSPQQRAQKRKGWNMPNAFHVCITSYQLVVHDHQSFKRRRWRYMILDEAHNIKNFRSTRWRALLNFNTENRLLLTGTPLQNNLMELWSLLYFLMPSSKVNQAMPEGFANLEDFQTWFGRPVDKIMEQTSAASNGDIIDENERTTSKMDEETKNTVARLHQVLRPYLLRRLKKDVEKQMPGKYEHIIYCRLSKRQRYLYDDFMSRAKTKETLASGNFLSIINCLMQLRKVCNHPDLFEVRPIVTSFAMTKSIGNTFASSNAVIRKQLNDDSFKSQINLSVLNLDLTNTEDLNHFVCESTDKLKSSKQLEDQIEFLTKTIELGSQYSAPDLEKYLKYYQYMKAKDQIDVRDNLSHIVYLNTLRCSRYPIYGNSLLNFIKKDTKPPVTTDIFKKFQVTIPQRAEEMSDIIEKYSVITPSVVALDMKDQLIPLSTQRKVMEEVAQHNIENPFSKSQVKLSIAFPDKSLLQYDCGKLQKLATLLHDLTSKGHRALIFTQMTKVLDILEQFLNIHGYRYLRLDGSTKIEDRQLLTERFNRDPKIPVFILSTRSGGLGINLTGADTVIFYDSDWNPAMDKQCQDRCHRIGQSRDVHIYRFVSEYTIESNILKKANQKRQLDNVVIQEGEFTTDYFGKFSVRDLVSDTGIASDIPEKPLDPGEGNVTNLLAQAEDEDDREAANAAMKEVAIDDEDFDEESKSAAGTPSQTPGPEQTQDGTSKSTEVDVDFEQGIGHVDEYMLRFLSNGYYWD